MRKSILPVLAVLALVLQLWPQVHIDQIFGRGKFVRSGLEDTRKPMFPGGPNALLDYLEKKLKYPYDTKFEGVDQYAKVQFTVNEDGSLSDLKVINQVDKDLQVAAIQIVHMMPPWQPATQAGKLISCQVVLPIYFNEHQKPW